MCTVNVQHRTVYLINYVNILKLFVGDDNIFWLYMYIRFSVCFMKHSVVLYFTPKHLKSTSFYFPLIE